jgi:hypothetical protein
MGCRYPAEKVPRVQLQYAKARRETSFKMWGTCQGRAYDQAQECLWPASLYHLAFWKNLQDQVTTSTLHNICHALLNNQDEHSHTMHSQCIEVVKPTASQGRQFSRLE